MPILFPVGDDHVRLATWLPECAAALQASKPDVEVRIGGYHDHLPHMGTPRHIVRGEMRSPAFSPVLAGVASARIREKQAAFTATTLLLRYAEPLITMARLAGGSGSAAGELVRRAWKQLFHNQAHDSAAGCGVDAAHEDVRARYRWAEQLAGRRAIRRWRSCASTYRRARSATWSRSTRGRARRRCWWRRRCRWRCSTATSPRAGPTVACGPSRCSAAASSVRCSKASFPPPSWRSTSAASIRRRRCSASTCRASRPTETAPGTVRLDVGLGDAPVTPESLVDDQRRVEPLLKKAERFKVLMHYGALSRPALVQGGPAPELSLVPIAFVAGKPAADLAVGAQARRRRGGDRLRTADGHRARRRLHRDPRLSQRSARARQRSRRRRRSRRSLPLRSAGAAAAPDAGARDRDRGRPVARAHRHRAGSSTCRRALSADRSQRSPTAAPDDADDDGDADRGRTRRRARRPRSTIESHRSSPARARARAVPRRAARRRSGAGGGGAAARHRRRWPARPARWRSRRRRASTIASSTSPMARAAWRCSTRGLPEHEVVREPEGRHRAGADAVALGRLAVARRSGGHRLGRRSDPAHAGGAGARRPPLRVRAHAARRRLAGGRRAGRSRAATLRRRSR